MRILVTTGIVPPQIGGPAQYALELAEALRNIGHEVRVLSWGIERRLPKGLSHAFFFFRVFFILRRTDFAITLDTFSAGFPTVLAGRLFNKHVIIRTGGDFLWESYIERTGDLVLLRKFYHVRMNRLSVRERIVLRITRFTLRHASAVVFSTLWQWEIFLPAYKIDTAKCYIIENYYGPKSPSVVPNEKRFIASTRPLRWKNISLLQAAFEEAKRRWPEELRLDLEVLPRREFLERMSNCYAVILVSLGEVSPNMVLEALSMSKPVILTRETGLFERLKETVLFVNNPLDQQEITEKILFLAEKDNWQDYKRRSQHFSFTHTWEEIAREFLDVWKKLKSES